MANPDHLEILKQGVEEWNEWRKNNSYIIPDFSGADLSLVPLNNAKLYSANLSNADLSNANLIDANLSNAILIDAKFSNANLRSADLSNANLSNANLSSAILIDASLISANLSNANLKHAYLSSATLIEANLRHADLRRAYLNNADLFKANLSNTDLIEADLRGVALINSDLSHARLINADLFDADLRGAVFRYANLSGANLALTQAIGIDFTGATLTGACIQYWNINAFTNLQNMMCNYIFMDHKRKEKKLHFTDRRPHDPIKTFAPGDFAKLVQKSLDTVDLIFREGLDWRAFSYSFQQLEVQYGNNQLAIHTIENQGDGTVIVKLAVDPTLNKTEVDRIFWSKFEMAQQALSGQYEARIADKDRHINQLFQLLQQLQEKLGSKYDLRGSKFGGGFTADGGLQIGGQFIDTSTQHDSAAAAQDIQSLLNQLSQSYPSTTIPEQTTLAIKAVEEIEKNPPLKARVVGALKAGGVEALRELIDHPAVAIVLAALEG